MSSFATKSWFARVAPILGSAALHATVLASVAGGHGPTGSAATSSAVLTLVEIQPEQQWDPPMETEVPVPTHQHPYPVKAEHDARQHPPSVEHTPLPATLPAAATAAFQASAAAALEAAAAPPGEATAPPTSAPRFTVSLGSFSQALPVAGSRPTSTDESLATTQVVPESAVSVPARLLAVAPVAYPPGARAQEVEADVPVEIVVDTLGRVTEAKLLRSAGYGFDESALDAVRRYRFSSARRSGQPVRVRMRWVVQFRLN